MNEKWSHYVENNTWTKNIRTQLFSKKNNNVSFKYTEDFYIEFYSCRLFEKFKDDCIHSNITDEDEYKDKNKNKDDTAEDSSRMEWQTLDIED